MKNKEARKPAPKAKDRGGKRDGFNKKEAHKPAPKAKDRGGKRNDFNKWDKGWPGPDSRHQTQARPQQRGQSRDNFKRFHPGIDHSRARDMARSHKMTGYKPLPNSVKKHLHIGRPLPPKASHRPVPEHMRRRLPKHSGYEWRITGQDLVLVAVGSLIVYEIFNNVFD